MKDPDGELIHYLPLGAQEGLVIATVQFTHHSPLTLQWKSDLPIFQAIVAHVPSYRIVTLILTVQNVDGNQVMEVSPISADTIPLKR